METFLKNNKKQIEQDENATAFYYNGQMKPATGFNHLTEELSIFDINNYVLDKASNKFIRKDIYQKGKDYSNAVVADYHDESIMIKYENIEVLDGTDTDFGKVKRSYKALFTKEY